MASPATKQLVGVLQLVVGDNQGTLAQSGQSGQSSGDDATRNRRGSGIAPGAVEAARESVRASTHRKSTLGDAAPL